MPAVDPVILELRANLRDYDNKLNASTLRAERSFQAQERAIQKLEFQVASSSRGIGSRLSRMGQDSAVALGRLQGIIGGVSLVALARGFLSAADASKQMEAQLRLATQSFGTYGQAQADVERLAAATRSGLSETASLYGNMVRATQQLGGTQAEAARATETFSKALKIGGADANEAASATLQFGQALASGALRGDEFNSIAEASPRILRLLAESLGVPQGALRKLAEEGKLTADVLQRALTDRKFTDGIDAEFRSLPVTFDDAMQQVSNAAVTTFGAFDRGGEFSTALANFATQGSADMQTVADAAEQAGIDIRGIFDGLGDVFDPMVTGAKGAFAEIGLDSRSLAEQIRGDISTLLGAYDKLRNLDVGAERAVRGAGNALVRGGVLKRDWFFTPESQMPQYADAQGRFERRDQASRRIGNAKARLRNAASRLEREGYVVPVNPDGSVDEGGIRRRKPAGRLAPTSVAASGGSKRARGPSADTIRKREDADRLRALRDDQQFENEKAGLNSDLLRAKQSIATAAETVAQYELQEIEAQRAQQNANYQAEVAQKQLTQARANELIALNDKVAAERASAVRLREEERRRTERAAIAEGDLQNARDVASAEGALAETSEDRKAAALRLLDLEYQMERARLDAILASKQSTEAEKEIARRRLAVLPQLQAADANGVERQNESPLERYQRRLNPSGSERRDRVEALVVDELDQVRDGINDAITSRLGIKDPLLSGLLDMLIEDVLLKPLADAFQAARDGSGGGGVLGSIAKAAVSLFGRASGGYMAPNSVARVNEGRGGVELLRMGPQGGTVIPLGQANATARPAASQQPAVIQLVVGKGQMFEPMVRTISGQVSVQTVQAAAPSIIDAGGRRGADYVMKAQRFGQV